MQTRRDFLKKTSLITGALGVSSVIPPAIQKALAITPDKGTTFLDAEHVVFLMQENRSFDHCFGTLKGVRGFNDPRAIRMENDVPVWFQSNAEGNTYAPFRLDMKGSKATWMSSLPHSWTNQVDAHNQGKMNGWLEAKKSGNKLYQHMPLTMGYYNREDIPFYYALADAFTICDQYFCSSLTGTSPNRCYFWSGTIREQNQPMSKAHVWNDDIDTPESVSWKSYPERLQQHGIDWKIYQNELSVAVGLSDEEDALLANFTDNTLENFKAYNVRLHQAHIRFLEKARAQLKIEIERLRKNKSSAKDLEDKQKYLQKLDKEWSKLEGRSFESLSAEEQELHRRAFVTNLNDPDYHQLVTFSYNEGKHERTLKIPKGDILHQFRQDVDQGKLPTVSWLVAPCIFSDHPGAPWFGAWYLSEVMDVLTKNPEVWKKTIFILTYDENDGYFDHVPPFVAPDPNDTTTGLVSEGIKQWESEYVHIHQPQGQPDWPADTKRQSPIGLGFRVPTIVASPWTRGGYVNSQVFDHTSCLQFLEYFLEKKTGKTIIEENINNWRRSVCGDLTSVFRPYTGDSMPMPAPVDKTIFIESIYNAKFKDLPQGFVAIDTPELQTADKIARFMPQQEIGTKPSCALPYELYVNGKVREDGRFYIDFKADDQLFGKQAAGAGFKVYADTRYRSAPDSNDFESGKNWSFSVKAGESIQYSWQIQTFESENYELSVYGPNGFYRQFKGSAQDKGLDIALSYEKSTFGKLTGNIILNVELGNAFPNGVEFVISDRMEAMKSTSVKVDSKGKTAIVLNRSDQHTWYDIALTMPINADFEYRFAGRVETGAIGITDPVMGREI